MSVTVEIDNVIRILQGTSEPMNVPEICRALGISDKAGSADREALERLLTESADSGGIHQLPARRVSSGPQYGTQPMTAYVERKILSLFADGEEMLPEKSRVKDGLTKPEKPYYGEALGNLINAKQLYRIRLAAKPGQPYYLSRRAPVPTDYLLAGHITALKEIVTRIGPHRRNELSIDAVFDFLNEKPTQSGHEPAESAAPEPRPQAPLDRELFRQWYEEDVKRMGGARSVPFPYTWARYRQWCEHVGRVPREQDFLSELQKLAETNEIELVQHSMPADIDPNERPLIIKGRFGETFFYWKWR